MARNYEYRYIYVYDNIGHKFIYRLINLWKINIA